MRREELKMTPEEKQFWECVIVVTGGELKGKRYGCPSITEAYFMKERLTDNFGIAPENLKICF